MNSHDDSLDSGIASATEQRSKYSNAMLSRQPRQRSRHFEMIPTDRHRFEIRDLNEMVVDDNAIVIPLELPKLPTDRAEILTGGLCRSVNSNVSSMTMTSDNDTSDMSISTASSTRPASLISTATSEEAEEEKMTMDTSLSEKSQLQSKSTSDRAGEALISSNDCSVVSSNHPAETYTISKKPHDEDDDDVSEMTITGDHTSYLDSVTLQSSKTMRGDNKEVVNDAFMRQPKTASIRRKELFFEITDNMFAETVNSARNSALLDDETSPTDSLVSSSESGEGILKKMEKSQDDGEICKRFDPVLEQDLEDISPVLEDLSPGTPTHASNSLSLSDGNRDDFLIDDEIADQPALVFNDKKHNKSNLSNSMNPTSATSTLREISMTSHDSFKSLTNHDSKSLQHLKFQQMMMGSPASNRRQLQTMDRSGSLDTLSPCDSIASDDLMADFELNSSLDSIDR